MQTQKYSKDLILLCVEDSPAIHMIYESLFSSLFKKIIFVETGEEALNVFHQADIIITDYQMPNMSGLDMTSQIRDIDKNIPIILVTAFENLEVLRDAIQLGINNFVKKPFNAKDLFSALDSAVGLVIGHKYLLAKQKIEIIDLKEKEKYSNYQEELSFKKELSIVRNDFYYSLCEQMAKDKFYFSDFMYKPLDILSGDLYSARQLNENQELYFLVDGMGKGISASMTAILSTSFINYAIDRVLELNRNFDLKRLVKGFTKYIRQHLLEDEVLAISFALIDASFPHIEYTSFGMPAILVMDKNNEINSLASNNPPLSQYTSNIRSTIYNLENMVKILISSDGIHENIVNNGNETYAEYIKEDFASAMTSEDFQQRLFERVDEQEDDMTYIFLHQILLDNEIAKNEVSATSADVEDLNLWYETQISFISDNMAFSAKASLAFSELSLNAYEHGAMGITNKQKHELIDDDKYSAFLSKIEEEKSSKIKVNIYSLQNKQSEKYILTKIEDEGNGFDTKILSSLFSPHKNFNGRGVFMAKKSSLGIYYNSKGNIVYFLNRI